MNHFAVSITFLDELYHGRADHGPEWPPSPLRLFQALLASAGEDADAKAFEWLEGLPPPAIFAPPAKPAQKRTVYVPNNTSDAPRQIKPDKVKRVEKQFAPHRIMSTNRTVHYCWTMNPAAASNAEIISGYARGITCLGWGIDLVVGRGEVLDSDAFERLKTEFAGRQWKPTPGAETVLRAPCKGSYENLKSVYKSQMNRFNGSLYTPADKPTVFDEVGYVRKGQDYRPTACFKLLVPNAEAPRWAGFDPRDTILPAAWCRGLLCDLARKRRDFPGDSETCIAGHIPPERKDSPPRLSYLPLPTIGHDHADGLIRRLIVAEPFGGDGKQAKWVRRVLQSAILTDRRDQPMAELDTVRHDDDGVFRQYTKQSRRFQTVTPVILPGYDGLKYSKAGKLFKKAILQAGFDPEDIDSFVLQKAPFFTGAHHPRAYRRAKHFENFSAMHVELCWKTKRPGPLAVGAGRHRGLGLFAPA